jgi:amino acid transporter
MLGVLTAAVDKALKGQASRLVGLADDYRQRLIYEVKTEVKTQVAAAGVMAALVIVGLFFMMAAVVIGLGALYYYVALLHGPMMGFAAAGGTAMVLSLLMFTILAMRSAGSSKAEIPPPELAKIKADARDALRQSQNAVSSLTSNIKSDIGAVVEAKARAAGRQTLDAATGAVRNGSRETLLITVAATAVIGLLLGRSAR